MSVSLIIFLKLILLSNKIKAKKTIMNMPIADLD